MKNVLLIGLVFIVALGLFGCVQPTEGEYCVKNKTGENMSFKEGIAIASNSECTKNATLKSTYMCNEYTGTIWIDLNIEKEGCSPACVVYVSNKTAEINWRCTGLLVPES